MSNTSYSEMQKIVNSTDFSEFTPLNIAVLRNITIEAIVPILQFYGLQMHFDTKVVFGEYDNVYQEVFGESTALINNETDCVLVFLYLETLSPDIALRFSSLGEAALQAEVERLGKYFRELVSGIREKTDGLVLFCGFEIPPHPAMGIWDAQNEHGQANTIRHLNELIRHACRNTLNAYYFDLAVLSGRLGWSTYLDQRLWHLGRAPYSRAALTEIGFEVFRFVRAYKGKNKKCLVLDCDNTLWGGIIGEDKLQNIKLGQTFPGSYYVEFQNEIVNLYNRGIILALCSKNNEADVWEVFDKHTDMVLKREHIAAWEINWEDKASNLMRLANTLNIGLESMVFVDDSEFEINLVRAALPEVETIPLPKSTPGSYKRILSGCGLFDSLSISEEDKQRGAMYRADIQRKSLHIKSVDMESYYKSLCMDIEITFAEAFSIPRISQLTQKTNQFNLTTRRYSEVDIERFSAASSHDVFCVKLADRFGGLGIVGVCVLNYTEDYAVFDSFLLSCRVLGRGVERVLLHEALALAQGKGFTKAVGVYIPTRKNAQVESFYENNGFYRLSMTLDPGGVAFAFDLTRDIPGRPDFFNSITSNITSEG